MGTNQPKEERRTEPLADVRDLPDDMDEDERITVSPSRPPARAADECVPCPPTKKDEDEAAASQRPPADS